MNKAICFLMVTFVLLGSVMAANPRVVILKLNYNDGNITLLNSTVKYGFFPDRRYQPDYGYRAEVISFEDSLLYEFRFKAPNEIFVDGTDEDGEISGGKIALENVNFALNVPYYEEMKEINIYSSEDEIVGSFSFEEGRNMLIIRWLLVGLIFIVTIALVFLIIVRNKKQANS
ncbi:MAG: hypothetical protein KAK00_10425 [Nanoarchaeota archaeon]|nr:hypothetical protein [Nanoarchaeota archaeon]